MSVVILDFPAGRCPYDDCSYDGIQHQHAIPDAEVIVAAPRDTVTAEPVREACANCGRSWQSCRDWDGGVFPCCGLCHHRHRALGESPNPTTGDAP